MNNTNKRTVLVGAGGSWKDYLKQKFIDKGFKPSVSLTTRAKRKGEIDGVDYHFVTALYFLSLVEAGLFFEHKNFNGWYYGTLKSDYETKDLFIMTPPAIEEMSKEVRESSMIFYIDISERVRHQRLLFRNDTDSVNRRLKADADMFDGFTDFDVRITSPNF